MTFRLEKLPPLGHIRYVGRNCGGFPQAAMIRGMSAELRRPTRSEAKEIDLIMHTATRAALRGKPKAAPKATQDGVAAIQATVLNSLSDAKAEDIVTIDLQGKTSIGDTMIIASGRSHRHVGAIADQLCEKLKSEGYRDLRVEGLPHCDWVLIDAGDVIVHVFRPEVRQFYNLERMWSADRPTDPVAV